MRAGSSVAVVGGGLGGLAAACVSAARGHTVTLYDKNDWLGGKAAVLHEGGFRFDMGPTILTVPRVLRRIFAEGSMQMAFVPVLNEIRERGDKAALNALETPAIAFFLTLPAPVPALEAWDTMLPTAQRMAELLDGIVLDEERNALGRQRIAHIRDELRAYDRQREAPPLTRPGRW